jgi:Transposase
LSDKRKYRRFTAKQKVELVLASLRGDRSIAEICREHDLSETLLRRWRDPVVDPEAGRDLRARSATPQLPRWPLISLTPTWCDRPRCTPNCQPCLMTIVPRERALDARFAAGERTKRGAPAS